MSQLNTSTEDLHDQPNIGKRYKHSPALCILTVSSKGSTGNLTTSLKYKKSFHYRIQVVESTKVN